MSHRNRDVGHSTLQQDRGGVVGNGSHHVEMTGGLSGQVAPQVTQVDQRVAKQAQGLPHEVKCALVLLSLLRLWQQDKIQRSTGSSKTHSTYIELLDRT